jgi:hypothetical protein
MKFSEWLDAKVREYGGIPEFCQSFPKFNQLSMISWIHGGQVPNYRSQVMMAEFFGVSVGEIRGMLGLRHTPFAELLARKILRHGKLADFPRQTEIDNSRFCKWMGEGVLPSNARWGSESQELREVHRALIKWGDLTPPDVLMAELVLAIQQSIAARKSAKASAKLSKGCHFDKIAS